MSLSNIETIYSNECLMSDVLKSLKPSFEKNLIPVLELLKQKNVNPNIISLSGVLVIALGSFLVYKDYHIVGGIIIGIGGILDALDGALARYTDKSSYFGAFLDSTLDRISDTLPILPIILIFSKHQDELGIILGFFTIVFSFLVSYTKARSHSLGVDIPVGIFERSERFGIITLSIIFGFYRLGLLIVCIGAFYTTIERILYAKRYLD